MTTDTTTPPATPDLAAIAAVVDTYLATWNEPDRGARAELAEQALGADLWYRDPLLAFDGREQFVDGLAVVFDAYPGHTMTRTSDIDVHHDVVRFTWALGIPGSAPVYAGVDMAKLDGDGRLHRIVGFAPESLA